MPVVLLIAAVAILAGVVVVAVGRGGELAMARSDIPPVRFALFTPGDVAAFRPRLAFFGYSARATDDALLQIARAVAERDAELSRLRVQLTALRDELDDREERADAASGPGHSWPEDDDDPADPWPPAASPEPGETQRAETVADQAVVPVAAEPAGADDGSEPASPAAAHGDDPQ
jgi:uncharacterized coiled-coil protein SlyX